MCMYVHVYVHACVCECVHAYARGIGLSSLGKEGPTTDCLKKRSKLEEL